VWSESVNRRSVLDASLTHRQKEFAGRNAGRIARAAVNLSGSVGLKHKTTELILGLFAKNVPQTILAVTQGFTNHVFPPI